MMKQEVIAVGQLEIRYLHDGSAKGELGTFEMIVQPGSNVPPPHSHPANEEILYVIDGKLRVTVNGLSRDLRAGEASFTPKGGVHGFSNPFSEPARALVVLSPDIGANYFRDVAAELSAGPVDRARLLAVMARYGLKPAS